MRSRAAVNGRCWRPRPAWWSVPSGGYPLRNDARPEHIREAIDGSLASAPDRRDRPVSAASDRPRRAARGVVGSHGRAGRTQARSARSACPRRTSTSWRAPTRSTRSRACSRSSRCGSPSDWTTSCRGAPRTDAAFIPFAPLGRGFLTGTMTTGVDGPERLPLVAPAVHPGRDRRQPGDRRPRSRGRRPPRRDARTGRDRVAARPSRARSSPSPARGGCVISRTTQPPPRSACSRRISPSCTTFPRSRAPGIEAPSCVTSVRA